MTNAILVVDFGVFNVRAIVLDASCGASLCAVKRKYDISFINTGYSEIAPDMIWSYSCECVTNALSLIGKEVSISALSFSFPGENLLLLEENYQPVYNCIMFTDRRAIRQGEKLASRYSREDYKISQFSPAAKVLYLKENMPQIFERTKYFVSIQQFILTKLGLPPFWDYTMAACHSFYNSNLGGWDPELLSAVNITEKNLGSDILSSCDIAGRINYYGNTRIGDHVPVVLGGHDSDLGLYGLGIIDEEQDIIGEVSGTFDHVGYTVRNFYKSTNSKAFHPGPLANTEIVMKAYAHYSTVLQWFMREIVGNTTDEAIYNMWKGCNFDGHPHVVRMSPCLFAENGLFSGIGLNTTKYEMFQAVIEALTFESRRLAESIIDKKSGTCTTIHIGGGPAVYDDWIQLRADVTGLIMKRMSNNDISAVGSCAMAAYGIGLYSSLEETIQNIVAVKDAFWPDLSNHARYDSLYRQYLMNHEIK